jgi:hypothetical protein
MENYTVILSPKCQHLFQIGQYPHTPTAGCKYKIFQNGNFVASLEPDRADFLHVCQNPAGIDLEILHLLAEQIEIRHPGARQLGDLENMEFDRDDEMEAPPQKSPVT